MTWPRHQAAAVLRMPPAQAAVAARANQDASVGVPDQDNPSLGRSSQIVAVRAPFHAAHSGRHIGAVGGGGRDAVWYVLEGILGIAVGMATFFYPNITAQALVYLVGFWAIMTGVFEVVAGFELPISRDWLLVLAGILSIVFGVLVFLNPGSGAVAIVWLIGIYALVFGVTMRVFGIRLRSLGSKLAMQTA